MASSSSSHQRYEEHDAFSGTESMASSSSSHPSNEGYDAFSEIFSMASSSSFHPRNEKRDAFCGIEPSGTRRKIDESSRLFDVFINHRGPDVKQTLALQLYNSLKELGIHAFLDSEEKELGDSFPSTIENAIQSAKVHIAIFSKGYAESPWCLAELVLMLQSSAKIIPVFYGVKPSALRYIESGEYGKAFTRYKEKGRYMDKLEEWNKALQSVSFLAGHEISCNFNDCQNIVSAVQKEFQRRKSLHVAKYPVGLHRLVKDFETLCLDEAVEDFERQCGTNEGGKEKAQIIGIFGMGGVGKTTLAKEFFNRKQSQYKQACFLFDAREASANNSFHFLQMKILNDIFQKDGLNFCSTEEGKTHIADCIERSNRLSFLIVVDDIDHVQQLDALLIMDMLNKSVDSLVIVTTRDAGVLISTGITVAYNLKGMDKHYARELFCWHAFGQAHPAKDYEDLVNCFLNVCGGLPLSLQVLGSHVHGRDQNYWSLELNRVRKILPREIHQRLKISFDALDYEEQQIFMDIACFFVNKLKRTAVELWEASGWSAQHALETLKSKCLVQEIKTYSIQKKEKGPSLGMHDHLRDLGREMANGLSLPRRLWCPQDLQHLELKGFRNILAQTRGRCFHSIFDKSMNCQITFLLGESDVSSEASTFLLWLKLEFKELLNSSSKYGLLYSQLQSRIPSWIPLQSLRCLIISNLTRRLKLDLNILPRRNPLQRFVCSTISNFFLKPVFQMRLLFQVPTQLTELKRFYTENTADLRGSLKFTGSPDLKRVIKLEFSHFVDLQELSVASLAYLENIVLHNCNSLETVSGLSDLNKLVELKISKCPAFKKLHLMGLNSLKCITVDYSFKTEHLELDGCRNLKSISGKLNLERLVSINIRDCPILELLPSLKGPGKLETVTIDGCVKLSSLFLSSCQHLKTVKGKFDLETLVIRDCPQLEAVPILQGVIFLETIILDGCGKLSGLLLLKCQNLKQLCILNCLELEELTCCAPEAFVEKISIVRCEKMRTITLSTKLVELVIQGCRELETVTGICNHSECLELSSVSEPSSVKSIARQTYDKLQTIQGIEGCGKLIIDKFGKLSIDGYGKLTTLQLFKCQNLKEVLISNCPELQDLRSVSRLSCLKRITIETCAKLETVKGIAELHALESLQLFNCAELEELPCSALPTRLEKISIVRCAKLQNITLPKTLLEVVIKGCRELKTVAVICDHNKCLELQELSSIAQLSFLQRITILTCEKLQTIQGIENLQALERLELFNCADLEELSCSALLTRLEKISIVSCAKLQNLCLPSKLVDLRIAECRELLTVAVICDHGKCLEIRDLSSISRQSFLKRITIESCEKLQIIQGIEKLHALESLQIFNCPELVELECSALQTCIEKIRIVRCGKLRNINLPTTLVELVIEGCGELKRVAVIHDRSERLQEFSNVARPILLRKITIQTCHKLQSIQGIGEPHALKSMQLSYWNNAAIQNCIPLLESAPSELLVVIGRAADGALSTLDPNPFSDADAFIPVISEIGTDTSDGQPVQMSQLSAVIFCYVVVVNGRRPVEILNQSLANLCWWNGGPPVKMFNQCLGTLSWWNGGPPVEMINQSLASQGEWVITIGIAKPHKTGLQNRRRLLHADLLRNKMLKHGYRVAVKNGKCWKTRVLPTIFDTLYQK